MSDFHKKYNSIFAENPRQLDERVNEALQDGWDLYGNPYYCEGYVAQAVIKIVKREQ